ncbi:hypothetical protein [Aquicoccus sp.]|uniref:hypothetical protein n=1 Tax=Aquicoccus sp. TaxID=2055851 RepID=UPI00356237A0
MKRICIPAVLAVTLTISTAHASGLSDPVIEEDLIATETAASSSAPGTGLLLFLAAVMTWATSR